MTNTYGVIPEKMIRQFAKQQKIEKIRGKDIHDITEVLIEAGHTKALDHLVDQFLFTKRSAGFVIEKPMDPLPEQVNTADKFIKKLKAEKKIPVTFTGEPLNWKPELNKPDEAKICGIALKGDKVYLKTAQLFYTVRKTGWEEKIDSYVDISPLAIHFSNPLIEYRGSAQSQPKAKNLLLESLGLEVAKDFDTLTKVTPTQAMAIKKVLKANLSSEHFQLNTTVGSIKLHSARNTIDLETDLLVAEIKRFLKEKDLASDDTLDLSCHISEFEDSVTGLKFPVTFEFNLKKGNFKFKSEVTERVLESVTDAITQVCYVQEQIEVEEAAEA